MRVLSVSYHSLEVPVTWFEVWFPFIPSSSNCWRSNVSFKGKRILKPRLAYLYVFMHVVIIIIISVCTQDVVILWVVSIITDLKEGKQRAPDSGAWDGDEVQAAHPRGLPGRPGWLVQRPGHRWDFVFAFHRFIKVFHKRLSSCP